VKYVKMLGLAAIAAAAVMAFVGASSAMAESTWLCKNNLGKTLTECSEPVTELHGVATNLTLLSSLVEVLCEGSLSKATVLGLGTPQVAHLTELTWTGCKTSGGSACEVKTLKLGLFDILKLSLTDAHVTSLGTEVNVHCGFFINCTYGGEPVLLALPAELPKTAGLLHANKLKLTSVGGGFCPEESFWDALYENLTDVYFQS
jgi:hypothetical protein